jgi:hypothetical protein
LSMFISLTEKKYYFESYYFFIHAVLQEKIIFK